MQIERPHINPNECPKVRSYIHVFQYFSDYYEYRKMIDSKFSFELWAVELGFKSRSQLRMICSGKRNATALVIESFSQKVNLSKLEKDHLYLMSHYQKAESNVQRKLYLDKILEGMETNSVQIESKNYIEFLSSLELPLIQLITGIPDFEGTETELKETLGLSSSQLKKSLETLEKIGLLKSTFVESQKEKKWVSVTSNFKIPDQHQNEALRSYHRENVKEMHMKLDENPVLRRFRSIMFTLGETDFSGFIEETELFLNRMKTQYGASSLQDKYIFKLNLNTYPVTEKYQRKSKK